jgi:2-polyprenyl-3-methyl-5-hydroxy-6-metoxy-1,4-benzoquinol methylase
LETHNAVLPRKRYNVVFLIQVLEHLPDPVSAIRAICDSLVDDGVLIFDFILSDGDGLDTVEALQQRAEVIGLLKRNFLVEEGRLSENESMGITVCRIAPTRGLDLLD